MNSNWARNKAKAIFINTKPSKTDQSQAEDTNINIIMRKYRITGQAPGASKAPIYADFTELPTSLAEMMETARKMPSIRASLPEQLRSMPLEQLLSLTPEDLTNILTPPAQPPANTPPTAGGPTT